jgi:outer membrane protein TolC
MLLPAAGQAASFVETVRQSVERHPGLALIDARKKVEAGYRDLAGSVFSGDPSLEGSASGDTLGTDNGYEEYVVGVSVAMWLPGQRSAKESIADNLGLQADAEKRRLAWEVTGEVLERAWSLRIAETDLKQSMKQWAAARALVQDIQHRYEVGELSRNDLLLAQQDLIDAESTYQNAVNSMQNARLSWRNYTGLDKLPEDLESYSGQNPDPDITRHPQIAAALSRARTAQARASDTRGQRRAAPVISLYTKRDRGDREVEYTDSIGIGFSLPLGTRAHAAPAIAEAESELTAAQAETGILKRQLELSIAEAGQELARANRQLELARQKEEFSRSRMKLAQRAFELGEMDLYQLLLARRQSNEATRNLKLRRLEKERAAARQTHISGVIPQ